MILILILTSYRQDPEIVIEKWEPVGAREYHTQQFTVYQDASVSITSGPLIIDFLKLFLQRARLFRRKDIEFFLGIRLLAIWLAQGFEAYTTRATCSQQ